MGLTYPTSPGSHNFSCRREMSRRSVKVDLPACEEPPVTYILTCLGPGVERVRRRGRVGGEVDRRVMPVEGA